MIKYWVTLSRRCFFSQFAANETEFQPSRTGKRCPAIGTQIALKFQELPTPLYAKGVVADMLR
jgi:hypothetical protein